MEKTSGFGLSALLLILYYSMNEFNADNHRGDVEIGQMHTNKVGLEEEEHVEFKEGHDPPLDDPTLVRF